MERIIPNLDKIMVSMVLCGDNKTEEHYVNKLISFEQRCEKSIIETLAKVDIKAMVKTDRYSLPHQEEVEVVLNGESYLNGPFEFYRVARQVVKELLNKSVYKIRFYFFINLEEGHFGFGRVRYSFRYYIH